MDEPTTFQPDVADTGDLDSFLGVKPESRRRKLIKWGLVALGVLLLAVALVRWLGSTTPVSYATEPVTRDDLTVTVSATGNLQPTNEVTVGSELSGLITKVVVDNNDRVARGQLMAQVDPTRFADTVAQSQAALGVARAAVGTARATLAQNKATLARQEQVFKLSGGKVPSATELDQARADYSRAVAGVRSAEAQVAQAAAQLRVDTTQLGKTRIVSPVNGVVLSRQVEPGQTVAASFNTPTLFSIAEDLSKMKLEAKVDEADVGTVQVGQAATFTVDAFPGRAFPARIARVDVGSNASGTGSTASTTTSAASTGTVVSYTAVLSVDNPDLTLRPGMTATADIVTTQKHDVLLVPNAALRFTPSAGKGKGAASSLFIGPRRRGNAQQATIGRGSRQTVYVLGADNTPRAVAVTAGDTDGTRTEVSGAGLRVGDKVVTGQLAAGADKARGGSGRRRGQGGGGG